MPDTSGRMSFIPLMAFGFMTAFFVKLETVERQSCRAAAPVGIRDREVLTIDAQADAVCIAKQH